MCRNPMFAFDIHNITWKKISSQDLNASLFSEDVVNEWLIHEYVVMYLANQRQATAHTKTRGEIRRSGRKLYRQKGTGSARVGDAWSPIRRKWWVVFGPRNDRNYSKQMNTKMKRKALLGAVTLKAMSNNIFGIDSFGSTEMKTKVFADALKWMSLGNKKVLVVLPEAEEYMVKTIRNINKLGFTTSMQLNPYDLMSHKNVIFIGDAYQKLEERLK